MDIASVIAFHVSCGTLPLSRGADESGYLRGRNVPAEGTAGDGVAGEPSVEEMIRGCTKCGSPGTRRYGFGSGRNGVMVILNSPRLMGKDEREGFKKESLDLMKKIIESARLDYRECYITNLVKCDTDDLLLKPSQVFESCRDILTREIETCSPPIVLVMGELMPLQKLVGLFPGLAWFNIDHPITLIRNSDLKKPAWNTMKLIMKKLEES